MTTPVPGEMFPRGRVYRCRKCRGWTVGPITPGMPCPAKPTGSVTFVPHQWEEVDP